MAIRIQHGDVADFAKLGLLAGRAQASVRREQQEFQLTSQLLQQQAAADRQRIALESQREMQEFSAFIGKQSAMRSQAWDLEKIETRARNEFELKEQANAAEFQSKEMTRIRREQETEQKIASVHKARESRDITEEQANGAILTLQTGISQFATAALRPEKEEDPLKKLIREKLAGAGETLSGVAETPAVVKGKSASSVAFLRQALTNTNLTPEDRKTVQEAIDRGTPEEVEQVISALSSVEGVQDIEEFSAERNDIVRKAIGRDIGRFTPLGAGIKLLTARQRLEKTLAEKTKRETAEVSDLPANALLRVLQSQDISEVDKILATKALRGNDPENMIRVKREILERMRARR